MAVVVGLLPAVVIQGWPFALVYETRFVLPVLAFAAFATVAILLSVSRGRWRAIVLAALVFLAIDRLVLQAFEESRQQREHMALGERLRPLVRDAEGLIVVVAPDRTRQSGEEVLTKATLAWAPSEAAHLWIVRPESAAASFGARSGCARTTELSLGPAGIRWPRGERVWRIFWASGEEGAPVEAYYRGCEAAR